MTKAVRFFAMMMMGISLAGAGARAQEGGGDYAARLEAAKAYAKTTSSRQMVGEMMGEISKNPQLGITQADVNAMNASIDFDALDKAVVESMAKHFSEKELNDLAAFYGSPTGASIMKKMPAYMADVMPVIQQQVMAAVMGHMQAKQKAAAEQKTPAPK